MSGGFKRSSRFGILGVVVVAGLCAAIGLTLGSGEANPKLALGLIFGVLALFFVVLFALQRADLDRVSGADARGSSRAAAEGGRAVDNPMTMTEPDLWAAMAVGPIDAEAVKARSEMWEAGRRSLRLGMVVTLLVFLTVPAIYLTESFVPLVIGGPLIVLAALWGSVRALMPGGEMDRGYDNVGRAMAPLGLAVSERPMVGIEMREPATPRMGPKIRGALVLSGERHGCGVSVRLGSGETGSHSEVSVDRRRPRVHSEVPRWPCSPGRRHAGGPCRGAEGRAELDPLEEGDRRGRAQGDRRLPQGRRAVGLALRPVARRAPRVVLSWATQTVVGRLVLLVSAVALIVLGSAAIAHVVFDLFDTYGAALWSAVLHLLDPSTLQDDEGAAERTIGIFQVVTGLVLLVGLLFTFVSETVGRSLERLGQSDRPLRVRNHLLIVGGTDMTPVAARAAADATRLRSAFERIVVLAPGSARDSRDQLRSELDEAAGDLKVDLVFGDPAGESGLELAAAEAAAAILLMPPRSGPVASEAADVETTQAGLALRSHLDERGANPQVCLLFRRGRNVDAAWELLPDDWHAVVGDRTVTGLLRLAMTRPDALAELPTIGKPELRDSPYLRMVRATWERTQAERRPLRLTVVGCNYDAPALMEDLAEVGAHRFEVTVIANREAFDRYLGEGDHSGIEVRFVETRLDEPDHVTQNVGDASPDLVLVAPSPQSVDPRTSDAAAMLTLLRVQHALGPETPIVAEFFLPVHTGHIRSDPRVVVVSALQTVTAAIALTLFDPGGAEAVKERLSARALEAEGQ